MPRPGISCRGDPINPGRKKFERTRSQTERTRSQTPTPQNGPERTRRQTLEPDSDTLSVPGAGTQIDLPGEGRARGVTPSPGSTLPDVPRGTEKAKAGWLQNRLASGIVSATEVATLLSIRAEDVNSIAEGKIGLAKTGWDRISEFAATRVN